MESSIAEDKKPEVKIEPKEEEDGSATSTTSSSPAGAQSKKKSTTECPFIKHPLFLSWTVPVYCILLSLPLMFLNKRLKLQR